MTTESYPERQARQLRSFMHWVKMEGGVEGPTLLKTLMQPHQMHRVSWLKSMAHGSILEVGCSWGFVTAWTGAQAGVDINPANIELARLLAPETDFQVADALQLPYEDQSFDTVMLPEVLEHLDFPQGVELAIKEACRVARDRILITMPDGRTDTPEACNFKHVWLCDQESLGRLCQMFPQESEVRHYYFWRFALLLVTLPQKEETIGN